MTQFVPAKTTIDEEHLPIGVTGGASRGADGIRGFADEQRLIAGHQVKPGQASGQCRRQLFSAYTH